MTIHCFFGITNIWIFLFIVFSDTKMLFLNLVGGKLPMTILKWSHFQEITHSGNFPKYSLENTFSYSPCKENSEISSFQRRPLSNFRVLKQLCLLGLVLRKIYEQINLNLFALCIFSTIKVALNPRNCLIVPSINIYSALVKFECEVLAM